MQNPLYKALITLGRSYEDARAGGWICGSVWEQTLPGAPKCVNGLLTFHLDKTPSYITEVTALEDRDVLHSPVFGGRWLVRDWLRQLRR